MYWKLFSLLEVQEFCFDMWMVIIVPLALKGLLLFVCVCLFMTSGQAVQQILASANVLTGEFGLV